MTSQFNYYNITDLTINQLTRLNNLNQIALNLAAKYSYYKSFWSRSWPKFGKVKRCDFLVA